MIEEALNRSKILWYQKSVTDRPTDGRNANPMSLDGDVGGQ